MKELNEHEMSQVTGGGEWSSIGTLWTFGGAALGVVAGVAATIAVAPAIVGVALIAGAAFAAAGTGVSMMEEISEKAKE